MKKFLGSICIRQRIAASYRKPFFELLASRCDGSLTVLAGDLDERMGEGITTFDDLSTANLIKLETVYRGSGVAYRYYQPTLLDHLSEQRPEIVVSEANPRFVDMKSVIRNVHGLGSPVVGWGAGTSDFWNKPLKLLRKWYRERNLGSFDGMMGYSKLACRQYQDLGYNKNQVFPLYNSTVPRPNEDLCLEKGPLQLPAKVIFIGRLVETKRIELLIRAAEIANAKGPAIELQIVGDGPDSQRLEDIAQSMKVEVKFMGRRVGDELATIARNADLFVLPGLGGLAIQEAMAHGLPIIVTEADGTELDLVTSNGWIAKKESVDSIANCILQALSDPVELRHRGSESFRIVRDEINLERMADRFIDAATVIFEQSKSSRSAV